MIYIKLFLFLLTIEIQASEFQYLNRSPRGLLMGDAYTAIADDEYTLFYNPAALSRNKGLKISILNPDFAVTNVLDELDRFENFPSTDPVAITNRIIGLPLYLHAGGTPSLKMETFGLSFLAAVTTNLELKNATHPTLDLTYKIDRGFVFGYAYTIGRKSKSGDGQSTAIGMSIKNVNRQGIFSSFNLFGLEILNKISSGSKDIYEIRKSLGYSKGKAWGTDLGIEHTVKKGVSRFTIGFSALDISDLHYKKVDGVRDIPEQKMAINLGTAWTQEFMFFDYSISFDIHPINAPIDFASKLHFGFKFGIPIFKVYGGWNGGYISYGLGIEFWPIKLYAGFYGIETGGSFQSEAAKRGILYLSLFNIAFDG